MKLLLITSIALILVVLLIVYSCFAMSSKFSREEDSGME